MDDTISRQAAIDALGEEPEVWTGKDEYAQGLNNQWYYDVNALKAVPSAQEWISCSERLPEYGVEVLTINKDDEYEINHIIDEEDGEWFLDGVVAWMPLPKKWESGQDNG